MEKGKFGISMAFYAVLGFILAVLGYSTGLFLLAGVVIFVEKNEWASRQIIQAICLMMVSSIIAVAFDLLGCINWTSWASYGTGTYALYSAWSKFRDVVYYGIDIVVFLFGLLAILKVAKGKEAGVPMADKFANWAYGKVVVTTVQQPVAPVAPVQQPVAPVAPVQQPVASAAPVQQPAAPAAPASTCANCGAPLNGAAFCTKCGTPAAK